MNKIDTNYCVLLITVVEGGFLIVRPDKEEKHLAFINEDREVYLKDNNRLTNAEILYINDFARHSPKESLLPLDRKKLTLGHFQYTKRFKEEGYSGVLSTGIIVDRRIYPNAIPMQENKAFGIPTPKINLK